MKQINVNIQIDNITSADLAAIEAAIEEALKEYKRKRIQYQLGDTFGLPIPEQTE